MACYLSRKEPDTGLLNDPNGFSYFDGKWICLLSKFSVWCNSWAQVLGTTGSDDLSYTSQKPVFVFCPDTPLEQSRCLWIGHAVWWQAFPNLYWKCPWWDGVHAQIGALLDKQNIFKKLNKVLIEQPKDVQDVFVILRFLTTRTTLRHCWRTKALTKKGYIKAL